VDDEIQRLTDRLAALAELPVTEHPAVLESVHAALVSELDRLAGRQNGGAAPDQGHAGAP
jgi:hypothetical protein